MHVTTHPSSFTLNTFERLKITSFYKGRQKEPAMTYFAILHFKLGLLHNKECLHTLVTNLSKNEQATFRGNQIQNVLTQR